MLLLLKQKLQRFVGESDSFYLLALLFLEFGVNQVRQFDGFLSFGGLEHCVGEFEVLA